LKKTIVTVFLLAAMAIAAKAPAAKLVDSGSFGIFINGKRVATENFRVEQRSQVNVAHAELMLEGASKAAQTAEIQLTSAGDLRHYAWQQAAPKSELTVDANDDFLVERIDPGAGAKLQQVPHLLPPSTMILDDNFFSHRELLAWRYLARGCKNEASGALKCQLEPTQFGVLIPAQHVPGVISIAYVGKTKQEWKGITRELSTFQVKTDGPEWMLYLDDQQKLVRITIPSENTEVVRD
jgi:hypothetical protein